MDAMKIAVMGDRESIMGFRALGLSVFPTETATETRAEFIRLVKSGEFAIIYITERYSLAVTQEMERIKDRPTPAVILIPDRDGSMGIGASALKSSVERAVGADIL